MHTIAKITPADYPDLLAAVEDGVSQRERARRYDCASSLVARHVAKARRARELGERTPEPDLGLTAQVHNGSMREILEARIRDPRTSERDLASLTNALARLQVEEQPSGYPSIYGLRLGTLILEPRPVLGPGPDSASELRYRLMMCVPGGIDHASGNDYDLTAADAVYMLFCTLGSAFGLTREAILGSPITPGVLVAALGSAFGLRREDVLPTPTPPER